MRPQVFALVAVSALAISPALAQSGKPGSSGNPERGKAVFRQCAICHNAESNVKKLGPGLKGLFKRAKLVNAKAATEANARALIDAGGNGMPPYRELLNAAEKDDLIAFLKTL